MTRKNGLKDRFISRIRDGEDSVFVRSDFEDIANYNTVGRILSKLVAEKALIRISKGIYARTAASIIDGEMDPVKSLPELAKEALDKFYGIKTYPTEADRAYNSGESTQVPTGLAIGVEKPISRKFEYNGKRIYFQPPA